MLSYPVVTTLLYCNILYCDINIILLRIFTHCHSLIISYQFHHPTLTDCKP
jgi:hypothetical protein